MPRALLLTAILILLSACALAQPRPLVPSPPIPDAAQFHPGQPFDVEAATNAYLAEIPPAERARSDAYFEGGYWLLLWDFLYTVVVMLILLNARLSARLRDWAERATRRRPLQTFLYWIEYVLLTAVLFFPITVYEGFFRERKYGLMNQAFGGWFRDYAISTAVGLVVGGIAVVVLFAIVRRLERAWWIWGAIASIVILAIMMVLGPVFIAPLFNKYTKLQDERVKAPILSMARANGINVSEVYEVNASKQSKRVSAFVTGFLGTQRIVLNDNLLNRCSLPEIEAVMGHEMGHYVLHHVYNGLIQFGVLFVLFFAYLKWGLGWTLRRWGGKWGIRGVGDPAVLPLVVLLGAIFFFVLTPVTNTMVRVPEEEADIFGLNASRQPDGEAQVDLLLAEYRKMSPGPVEEFIFFDHPSGRSRIHMAMRWKAEHRSLFEAPQK
jgi:STE24 endopeptidase